MSIVKRQYNKKILILIPILCRARYEMNSISTKSGNKAKGQPAGTSNEKKCSPCFWKPNIVAPKTIVKLKEKVNIKWLVEAKLYGIIPIKLFIKIKTNKA